MFLGVPQRSPDRGPQARQLVNSRLDQNNYVDFGPILEMAIRPIILALCKGYQRSFRKCIFHVFRVLQTAVD